MSVNLNVIGTVPGAGGSFPMAGTRPKQRRVLTFLSSSRWIAPENCYFIELTMCGGGGGASGGTFVTSSATYTATPSAGASVIGPTIVHSRTGRPGASAASLLPTIIPVIPGQQYNITVGFGGDGGGATNGTAFGLTGFVGQTGSNGGNSSFVGDIIAVTTLGGAGGSSTSGVSAIVTGSGSIPQAGALIISQSSWGLIQIPGTTPATSFTSASINFTSFLFNYSDGVDYNGGTLYYQNTVTLSSYAAPNISASGFISSSAPRIEYTTTGSFTSSVLSTTNFTHGGAPSFFANGASVISISGSRPATPGFGAGGAANAFLVLRTGTGGTPPSADIFQGIPTSISQSVGFGGNGGPGMVRIIWEE